MNTPDDQMRQDIRDIKLAVIGDERLGTTGLVSRVDKLEKKQRFVELRLTAFLSAAFVIWEGLKLWVESKKL